MKTSLVPFMAITLKTKLSKSNVIELLDSNTSVFKKFSFKNLKNNSNKLFYGKIIGDKKFEIFQIIKGRNSFNPLIKGIINGDEIETKIDIKMRFHLIIIAIILFFIGFLTIGNILDYVKSGVIETLLIGIAMSLFLYIFAMYEFNKQTEKVTEILKSIFKAEIV